VEGFSGAGRDFSSWALRHVFSLSDQTS
jgi:hypothetical protein